MGSSVDRIKQGMQSTVSKVKETTEDAVEFVSQKMSDEDTKVVIEKGRDIAKDGAEKTKKAARHLWSIQSVKNAVAGAVVGMAVGCVLGTIIGGIVFLAKAGFIVGAIYGFVKK